MIKLSRNRYVYDSVETILWELKDYLVTKQMFDYLRTIKLGNDNIQVCCPYHKDGLEKRPSAGITTRETQKTPEGTFHCFTCHKIASLPEYISMCLGNEDNVLIGERWLIDNFYGAEYTPREKIIGSFMFSSKEDMKLIDYVSEEQLRKFRFTHPYMYDRGLTDDLIDYFDVGYDKYYDCITFPVNDIDGNCLFIARRAVKYKMFNYPPNSEKPVYGLDKIKTLIDQGIEIDTVYVCESIFNALTLWSYGLYAVALLGTGNKQQYGILDNFNVRKYILAFDGDEAGDNAVIRFIKNVKTKIITYLYLPRGEDINSITNEEFKNLEEEII